MKKHIVLSIIVLLLLMVSCKDDNKTLPSENPVSALLKDTSIVRMGVRTAGPWELGLAFSASLPGKISHVGVRMPDPGSYRVLLWDFNSQTLLRQKTIEQSVPGKLTMAILDEPLILEADKKYVISVNTHSMGVNKKYYWAARADFGEMYPIQRGSILIHTALYSPMSAPTFPTTEPFSRVEIFGLPDFTFVPD